MVEETANSPNIAFNSAGDGLEDAPYTKNLLSHAPPEALPFNYSCPNSFSTFIKQQPVSSSALFLKAG
jgi:hypothetical protein